MITKGDVQTSIRSSTQRFLDAAGALSEAQWSYRPSSGGWSASEVTEHVAIANKGVYGMVTKRLTSSVDEPLGVVDDEIPYLFYRGDEPPNVAAPSGTWTDAGEAIQSLDASASAVIDWADATDLDLRACAGVHPAFGLMDGIQWLLFVNAHTERHRAQIIGLRQLPDFPD